MKRASILSTLVVFLLVQGVAHAFLSVVEDSTDRFEVVFDNNNFDSSVFNPVGGTGDEFVELFTVEESVSIAISIGFYDSVTGALNDDLFLLEAIAGDPTPRDPHRPGDVLIFNETDFSGGGLLAGFDSTEFTVTVGSTQEDPFSAQLVLSKVSVPESASTAVLLGLVLLGLASHRLRANRS